MILRAPAIAERPAGPESTAVVAWPPAKVNLWLSVGGRREDGYHEIDTLFQAVDLCDRLSIELGVDGVELEVDGADLGPSEDNLCVRAARLYREASGRDRGVRIRLHKGIPAGAGLGGGSSDAAATLRALDALARAPLGPERLSELGASLGSDVPFFLGASTLAHGRGRGDRLAALDPLPAGFLVLALPPVHVDTGEAYRALSEARAEPDGAATGRVPRTWDDVAELARNDFEEVVSARHPEVRASLEALRDTGACPALLSGSGAASFGVFAGWSQARAAAEAVQETTGYPAVCVRTLSAFGDVLHERP